jgi:hypothetical protein
VTLRAPERKSDGGGQHMTLLRAGGESTACRGVEMGNEEEEEEEEEEERSEGSVRCDNIVECGHPLGRVSADGKSLDQSHDAGAESPRLPCGRGHVQSCC